ncbi:rhodanese family protein [Sphingobium sp. ZW T5_29]|uniref:rhodanese family protein n=1 Tax=Sphingobium sp. ZW T5_29 TaxID=3378077 RepID=UPI0038519581
MTISSITPEGARSALVSGATLIDIRDPDEYARERIAGAVNLPLAKLGAEPLPAGPLIFHCRTGMRTSANAAMLAAAAGNAPCYMLEGGIEGWRGRGLGTAGDKGRPLEMMRQVQLAAGSLILLGATLGWLLDPLFFALPGFVGAGLLMAGATGWCGMANLLRIMPWNRASA